jgi:hypothetical protein
MLPGMSLAAVFLLRLAFLQDTMSRGYCTATWGGCVFTAPRIKTPGQKVDFQVSTEAPLSSFMGHDNTASCHAEFLDDAFFYKKSPAVNQEAWPRGKTDSLKINAPCRLDIAIVSFFALA